MVGASVHRLIDIDQRPIKIVKSRLEESSMGSYLVMEDDKGRVIVTGGSMVVAEYAHVPAPFYIT